ncbi:MAG TPA: hypothetical protein PL048_20670, partial [Leptospiraceae bacterium]|nr:hypothetical protein [Leptospiraceae bacterium]
MLQIAYGESNFENLRNDSSLFIDKTKFISSMEYVIRNLHWEYLQKFLEESGVEFDMDLLYSALREMSETGEVNGLKELALNFFQNRLSSYDYSVLTEKHVKFMFISYFTLSRFYNIVSEREIAGRKRIL